MPRTSFRGLILTFAITALLCCVASVASAQSYLVVATCGTLPSAPAIGSANGPIAIDVNGRICISSGTVAAGAATYPPGATPVTASATGTTGAVTATLPAAAAKTTYLCSVQIGEAGSGTATATATNTISGTLNYVVTAPGNFTVSYNPCVPANAVNTTIPVATAANATATAVAVTATGFQL